MCVFISNAMPMNKNNKTKKMKILLCETFVHAHTSLCYVLCIYSISYESNTIYSK